MSVGGEEHVETAATAAPPAAAKASEQRRANSSVSQETCYLLLEQQTHNNATPYGAGDNVRKYKACVQAQVSVAARKFSQGWFSEEFIFRKK